MNWITAKDCNGLVEMEKGKVKRELISEFVEDLKGMKEFTQQSRFNLIKKWENKLK